MFFIPVMIAMDIELAKIERQRFNMLTPEQQNLELRQREVRALERIANAKEESNSIRRNKFF